MMVRELGLITELQTDEKCLKNTISRIGFDATTQEGVHVKSVHVTFKSGFQGQVLEDLQLQVEDYDAEHRYVCLRHDKMSIKTNLVFDRKSNDLIGYVSPQEFDEGIGLCSHLTLPCCFM